MKKLIIFLLFSVIVTLSNCTCDLTDDKILIKEDGTSQIITQPEDVVSFDVGDAVKIFGKDFIINFKYEDNTYRCTEFTDKENSVTISHKTLYYENLPETIAKHQLDKIAQQDLNK